MNRNKLFCFRITKILHSEFHITNENVKKKAQRNGKKKHLFYYFPSKLC